MVRGVMVEVLERTFEGLMQRRIRRAVKVRSLCIRAHPPWRKGLVAAAFTATGPVFVDPRGDPTIET